MVTNTCKYCGLIFQNRGLGNHERFCMGIRSDKTREPASDVASIYGCPLCGDKITYKKADGFFGSGDLLICSNRVCDTHKVKYSLKSLIDDFTYMQILNQYRKIYTDTKRDKTYPEKSIVNDLFGGDW